MSEAKKSLGISVKKIELDVPVCDECGYEIFTGEALKKHMLIHEAWGKTGRGVILLGKRKIKAFINAAIGKGWGDEIK